MDSELCVWRVCARARSSNNSKQDWNEKLLLNATQPQQRPTQRCAPHYYVSYTRINLLKIKSEKVEKEKTKKRKRNKTSNG